MVARRDGGVLTLLAEAQRRRRREQEAQHHAWMAAGQEQQKAERAAHRAAARGHRAAMEAYQNARESEAVRQTAALEQQVSMLGRILADGAALPPVVPAQLRTAVPLAPFQPGALAVPTIMPDPRHYQVPPLAALQSISPAARRDHAARVAQARDRHERDWHLAQAAEADRLRRLGEAQRRHQAWLLTAQQQAAEHNARADALPHRLGAGEAAAVEDFFTAVLYVAAGWPPRFPCDVAVEWDAGARQLIVDWQLPSFDVVPDTARIRYVKRSDEYRPIAMAAGRRATLYRDALGQSSLRVVDALFRADRYGLLASIAFNGQVVAPDPATGQETGHCVVSGMIRREDLHGLQLGVVDAATCLRQLRVQVSARPELLERVRSVRRARREPDTVDDRDLSGMDPARFEELVADLFRARGLEVTNTARSGDGGVDVEARDPDPITGGLIVIQAKRYRATVSPSVVRELYGVVQHRGATKGVRPGLVRVRPR
jgi:restriction system protein